jgi:hypothetical protein
MPIGFFFLARNRPETQVTGAGAEEVAKVPRNRPPNPPSHGSKSQHFAEGKGRGYFCGNFFQLRNASASNFPTKAPQQAILLNCLSFFPIFLHLFSFSLFSFNSILISFMFFYFPSTFFRLPLKIFVFTFFSVNVPLFVSSFNFTFYFPLNSFGIYLISPYFPLGAFYCYLFPLYVPMNFPLCSLTFFIGLCLYYLVPFHHLPLTFLDFPLTIIYFLILAFVFAFFSLTFPSFSLNFH